MMNYRAADRNKPALAQGSPLFPPRFPTKLSKGARDRWWTMREEFASNSFLAVTVAGVVLLFSGLIAFAFN
jgi:hypothetical protein